MQILLIQTAFIGDVILATPLIERLRELYPDAQLDFLLRKGNEGLLNAHPKLREVLVWDKKAGKYKDMWRLLRQIRATKYDWVINCQRFAASGILTAFSGAKQTVGFDKNPFSFLFSKKIPHQIGNETHETERNMALLSALSKAKNLSEKSDNRPRLYPQATDFEKIEKWLPDTPFVCMAPTSVWFTKQWPAHKWVALIDTLRADYAVFLLGGPADRAACSAILEKTHSKHRVKNLAGELSFLASAALMAKAKMNYVNDSAPMHMASAVNAPVTAIFCSTVPAFGFGPLSDDSHIWEISEPLACRPCGLHGKKACPEGHFRCAEMI